MKTTQHIVGVLIGCLFLSCAPHARWVVDSKSMSPTLLPGERVLVDESVHIFKHGDIIIYCTPEFGDNRYNISRIVAVESDELKFEEGSIIVNDKHISYAGTTNYSLEYDFYQVSGITRPRKCSIVITPSQLIPVNHVFVLGDCPSESYDSRQFGVLPNKQILGVVKDK